MSNSRSCKLRSSLGKKALMAISGLMLLLFVIGHLVGNLLVFLGPHALNDYAQHLRDLGPLLWVARIGLLAAVAIHIVTSVQLVMENRRARGQRYAVFKPQTTTLGARTMAISGLMVLAFIVYHLMHFTFRVTHPEISHAVDAMGRHDVYRMVVLSFRQPVIAIAYVWAMALLFLHLSHGVGSTLQTLGANTERTIPMAQRAGRLLAWALFIGYISIPLAITLGAVPAPTHP
jgi:succinate dehydrogenase / fumarate reductase cytochrome b subunit